MIEYNYNQRAKKVKQKERKSERFNEREHL